MTTIQSIAVFLLALIAAGCAAIYWLVLILNGISHGNSGDFPINNFAALKWSALIFGSLTAVAGTLEMLRNIEGQASQAKLNYLTLMLGAGAAIAILLPYMGSA